MSTGSVIVSNHTIGLNCWSPARFTNNCHKCDRYDRCTYPERKATEEFDDLRTKAAALKAESDELYARIRHMKGIS